MDVYGSLFRSVLFPAWETHVRRRPVLAHMRHLEHTQWWSLDQLHDYQATALRRLVEHAYHHVPWYRARMDMLDVIPSDIRRPEDLVRIPVARRPDLRGPDRDRMSTVAPFPTIRKQTSGTTGEPLLFGFEPESEHWKRAVRYRGYAWAGYEPGDRVLHFWGAALPTPPPWYTRAKMALDRRMHREHYVPCAVMTEEHLDAVATRIATLRPKVLVCYAQAGGELARHVLRKGLRRWDSLPVICGAERVTARDRADLEAAFGPVFDVYGCREVMMIAGECEAHAGLHIAMENLIVEIVVYEDGQERPAREGETGEVVLTDLHNLGMPFVRYANGDVATAGPSGRCACGRALPRIAAVQGRMSETLRDGNGAAVSGIALSYAFYDVSTAVRRFQVVQHRDRSVTIRVVPLQELPAQMLAKIRTNATRLLTGIDVRVELVRDLPRSSAGKHKLVVVEQ